MWTNFRLGLSLYNATNARDKGSIEIEVYSQSQNGMHPRKAMLRSWWDIKGLVHHKLPQPSSQSCKNTDHYLILTTLSKKGQNCLMLQHDNATTLARTSQEKLMSFN